MRASYKDQIHELLNTNYIGMDLQFYASECDVSVRHPGRKLGLGMLVDHLKADKMNSSNKKRKVEIDRGETCPEVLSDQISPMAFGSDILREMEVISVKPSTSYADVVRRKYDNYKQQTSTSLS